MTITDSGVTAAELSEATRALGIDAVARGDRVFTLGTILAGAQRRRLDAVHVSVMLDQVAIRPGCTWRPVCCWCADAIDVAIGREIEAHRINRDTDHDTGCCSFCSYDGRDTLVVSVPDEVFATPPKSLRSHGVGKLG